MRATLLGDLGHPHRRDLLTVAVPAAVVLAALLLEHQDLLGAAVGDDLATHACTLDQRRADANRAVGGGEQHLAELDRVADIARETLDVDEVSRGDTVLLASGADDGVAHG